MPRQYPAGGSYRGQYNYRQEPTASEYESFFNPVPLDFIQNQFDRRQGAYDTAFAGSVAAKEQMAQQQAALQDLGSKNQIINDTMGRIDKVVEEKYGGDWGRASKEIAGMVSSARQNPFWETTKHLAEQQKVQQEFQLKNPNAWVYQDTLGQSTIDPDTGKVRDRESLTFRGAQRGDYETSIERQYADVKANVQDYALQQVKTEGVEGMLQKTRIEEIKAERLQALAKEGVDTFLTNNPDYLEGHMSLGMTEAEVRQKAEGDIYGQIKDKEVRSATTQVMQDKAYFEDLKARAAAGAASSGIVIASSGDAVEVAIDDPTKSGRDRRQTKKEIDKMKDGAEKQAMQKQFDKDGKALEFVIHNTQNSQHAVDFDPYYEQYVETVGKDNAISRDVFENNIYDALRDGQLPGVQDIDTDLPENLWGSNAGITYSNEARQAGRELRQAMRKFHNGDGAVAMNVNVIGGELGTKDQDTYVGRFNNLITQEWNSSTTGFTVPYSNRQIGDILENDKRYNGKKRNTLPRDSRKDKVRMTDGFMNGKPVYQVTFYDKDGSELGSEYVSPNNTESSTGNMQNAAVEMINSGDPQKQDIGQNILINSVYSPAIQNADIHNKTEGTFKGVQHDGAEVQFEKTAQGKFHLFIMVDGKKDYFQKEDSQGNIVNFEPEDEAGIKNVLLAAQGL